MMTRLRRFWTWHTWTRHAVSLLLLLMVIPVFAQETPPARGPVVEGNPRGGDIDTLNPLFCTNNACRRMTSLLYPTLITFNPSLKAFTSNLAVDWTGDDETGVYTFTLTDRTWSDGTPVTTYDVFFSYLVATYKDSVSPYRAQLQAAVSAVALTDERTMTFYFQENACGTLNRLNIPIIPAHVYDPTFAEDAAALFSSGADPIQAYQDWLTTYPPEERHRNVRFAAESLEPTVTAGDFRYTPGRDNDGRAFRLYAVDPTITPEAYVLVDTRDANDTVDRFINGEINFIANPPIDRRADLRAMPGVQIAQFTGQERDYIAFNLADPDRPRTRDNSEPSGDHPLFADPNVREAVRLAIDVESLIEIVMQGDGQPVRAENAYNLVEAKRLLEAAHWKDTNGDGIRECVDCPYAENGDTLSFMLLVSDAASRLSMNATIIQEQLRAAGFAVNINQVEQLQTTWAEKRFDAYLARFAPHDLASNLLLCADSTDTESDKPMIGDFPMLWLYVPDEFYVAAPGVQNFAPQPGAPLVNMTEWAITK